MAVASPGTVAPPSAHTDPGTLSSIGTRQALAGFFLSGVMLSFLGAILPSWQHLSSDYFTVGLYFLGLIAGLLSAVGAAPWLLEKKGLSWTLSFACAIAGTGFLYLAMASPPWDPWWRVGGMAVIGFAAGLLHTAIFEAISPMYRHDPAATVNVAGMLFGLGCLTVALLVSGIYYIYTPAAIQVWIAVIPALAGWGYWKTRFAPVPAAHSPAPREILSELRSPAAVLLSLILFFVGK
jgi:MFS family permease